MAVQCTFTNCDLHDRLHHVKSTNCIAVKLVSKLRAHPSLIKKIAAHLSVT